MHDLQNNLRFLWHALANKQGWKIKESVDAMLMRAPTTCSYFNMLWADKLKLPSGTGYRDFFQDNSFLHITPDTKDTAPKTHRFTRCANLRTIPTPPTPSEPNLKFKEVSQTPLLLRFIQNMADAFKMDVRLLDQVVRDIASVSPLYMAFDGDQPVAQAHMVLDMHKTAGIYMAIGDKASLYALTVFLWQVTKERGAEKLLFIERKDDKAPIYRLFPERSNMYAAISHTAYKPKTAQSREAV